MKTLIILLACLFFYGQGYGRQWIIFYADSANSVTRPGNIFVSLIQNEPNGNKTYELGTWGFYAVQPKTEDFFSNYAKYPFGYFGSMRWEISKVADEKLKNRFIIELNMDELKSCFDVISQWKDKTHVKDMFTSLEFFRSLAESIPSVKSPEIKSSEINANANNNTFNADLRNAYTFVQNLKLQNAALEQQAQTNLASNEPLRLKSKPGPLIGTVWSDLKNLSFFSGCSYFSGALMDFEFSKELMYSIEVMQKTGKSYIVLSKSSTHDISGHAVWTILDTVETQLKFGPKHYLIFADEPKINNRIVKDVFAVILDQNVKYFKPVRAYRVNKSLEKMERIAAPQTVICQNKQYGYSD